MNIHKRLRDHKTLIFFLLLWIASAAAYRFAERPIQSLDVAGSIFSTLLGITVIGIFYEYLIRSSAMDEYSQKAVEAFISDESTISLLSEEKRRSIARNAVVSLVRNNGEAVFDTVLLPYINGTYSNRYDYNYCVSYGHLENENLEELSCGLYGSDSKYYKVSQSLEYTKDIETDNYGKEQSIFIALVFSEKLLDSWFKTIESKGDIFYREVMYLDDSQIARAQQLTSSQWNRILSDLFELRVWHYSKDGEKMAVAIHDDDIEGMPGGSGITIRINIDKLHPYVHGKGKHSPRYRCGLTLAMPQNSSARKFVVVFPKPTSNPSVIVTFPDSIARSIATMSFLPDQKRGEAPYLSQDVPGVVRIRIPGWVFPRSGVVFMWDAA